MLGSPLASSEGESGVVTNARFKRIIRSVNGKTCGIDFRHFELLKVSECLGFKLRRELSIEILNHPTPFISVQSPKLDQVACLWEPE